MQKANQIWQHFCDFTKNMVTTKSSKEKDEEDV